MGVVIKIISALLVLGGLYVWFSGQSVRRQPDPIVVPSASLSASAVLAPPAESGSFDEEGTIVLDMSHGTPGTPFILYTDYNAQGKPAIRTKRLVFPYQAKCEQKNLPCASDQPNAPVNPDEKVRVTGVIKDDTVTVTELTRISS
jgi:hypothetical protein